MNKLNVLLVDDDEAIGKYLVPDVLENSGHTFAWRDTVPKAREYIAAVAAGEVLCDAIILDFRLDNGDGSQQDADGPAVLPHIRKHLGEKFPVIGFSTARMEDMGVDDLYMDLGKEGVFDLPIVLDGLAMQVADRASQRV